MSPVSASRRPETLFRWAGAALAGGAPGGADEVHVEPHATAPMTSLTVIFCAYANPALMIRTLESVAAQHDRPEEVIIADDGSDPAAGDLYRRWAQERAFPLTHVWHPRGGYRAGEICNKAARVARGDYLLFIDQDCLLHPGTVAAWRKRLRPRTVQLGPRIHVMPPATDHFVPGRFAIARAGLLRQLRGLRGALRRTRLLAEPPPVIESCNMLMPREAVLRTNGFDEAFQGWGYEDAEFFLRTVRAGNAIGLGGASTTVFHLHHESRASDHNRALFEERVRAKTVRCERGADRHDPGTAEHAHHGRYRRVAFRY